VFLRLKVGKELGLKPSKTLSVTLRILNVYVLKIMRYWILANVNVFGHES